MAIDNLAGKCSEIDQYIKSLKTSKKNENESAHDNIFQENKPKPQ